MQGSETYWSRLLRSTRRVGGWGFAVLISVIGLSAAETLISIRWFWFTAGSLLIATLILVDFSVSVYRDARQLLPRVVASAPPGAYFKRGVAVLLLAPSPLFSPGTLVSIYLRRGKFEAFAGLGTVTTIQADGRPQVLVTDIDESVQHELKELPNNNADLHEALIIKPSVPDLSRL